MPFIMIGCDFHSCNYILIEKSWFLWLFFLNNAFQCREKKQQHFPETVINFDF